MSIASSGLGTLRQSHIASTTPHRTPQQSGRLGIRPDQRPEILGILREQPRRATLVSFSSFSANERSSLFAVLKQRHVFNELPRTTDVEQAASLLFGEMARCRLRMCNSHEPSQALLGLPTSQPAGGASLRGSGGLTTGTSGVVCAVKEFQRSHAGFTDGQCPHWPLV